MSFLRRAIFVPTALAVLGACPAPRRVSGNVFASSVTTADGVLGLIAPVQGATVTWTCPSGGPAPPSSLTTDVRGRFESGTISGAMPPSCELVVSKPGHLTFRQTFATICGADCRGAEVAIELRRDEAAPPAIASGVVSAFVPLDAPPVPGAPRSLLTVVIPADGAVSIDDKVMSTDDELLTVARGAREKNPEVRAVLKADSSVPHGRVIHVLDLLKQAQIGKIAFGVVPIKPSP